MMSPSVALQCQPSEPAARCGRARERRPEPRVGAEEREDGWERGNVRQREKEGRWRWGEEAHKGGEGAVGWG